IIPSALRRTIRVVKRIRTFNRRSYAITYCGLFDLLLYIARYLRRRSFIYVEGVNKIQIGIKVDRGRDRFTNLSRQISFTKRWRVGQFKENDLAATSLKLVS